MYTVPKEKILNREQTIRYLGYKNQSPNEAMLQEINECESDFLQVVDTKYIYEVYDLVSIQDGLATIDLEFKFSDAALLRHLKEAKKVAFACITLGKAVDELISQVQNKDMLKALLYDAIANAAIENARFDLEKNLKAHNSDFQINYLFGIGYEGTSLTMQPAFLKKIKAEEKLLVTANNHCILQPLKTVTGFIGLFDHNQKGRATGCHSNCSVCNWNKNCIYKKYEQDKK